MKKILKRFFAEHGFYTERGYYPLLATCDKNNVTIEAQGISDGTAYWKSTGSANKGVLDDSNSV